MKEKRCAALLLNFLTKKAPYKGPGADSEEKHEPVSDIDTIVMDSLKALDPNRPIREADMPFVPHGIAPVPRFARSSQLPKQNPAGVGRADGVENYECPL